VSVAHAQAQRWTLAALGAAVAGSAVATALGGGAAASLGAGLAAGAIPVALALSALRRDSRERAAAARQIAALVDPAGDAAQDLTAASARVAAAWEARKQRLSVLDAVLDRLPEAIVLCDRQGLVALSNSTADDLLHAGKPLEGQRFDDVLAGCPPDMASAVRRQADVLFTVEHDEGSDSYLVSRPSLEVGAGLYRLYVIKQLTRELGRQEVVIWKKIIRVISHELNNSLAPISSLIHSARLIAGKPEHAERLETIFDTVEERTAHLKEFLEGYLRFARLAPPAPETVDWDPFLDGVRNLSGCRLEGSPPEEPGWFDPAQIQQALMNFLKNAAEAGSPAGETVLRASAAPDRGVRLSVLDQGKGMSDDVLRQALIPFYSTKKSGTGLGLALCREIVEAHDGTLRIERRTEGGTAVHVWLPGRPHD